MTATTHTATREDLIDALRLAAELLRDAADRGRVADPAAMRTSASCLQEIADRPADPTEEAARTLAADATEYRVLIPEGGGTDLLVRRQTLAHGDGWAVSTTGRGGGRAWTTEGWQESVSALTVERLFCWPDAATAVDAARRALADG